MIVSYLRYAKLPPHSAEYLKSLKVYQELSKEQALELLESFEEKHPQFVAWQKSLLEKNKKVEL